MKHRYQTAVLTAIILSFLQACKPGEIELRLKPKHNSHYRMLFNTHGNVSMNLAGKDFATDVHTGIASLLQVDTVGSDKYQFTLTYDDYNIEQQVDGKKINLKDLPTDSNDNVKKGMAFIKGISFVGLVNSTGKSENIKGTDRLVNRLDSSMEGMPAEVKKQVMSALAPMLSSDMAKGMLDQCFYVFPPGKVNIGDSWKNEIIMQTMFSMVMKSTYTLLEIKDSIATLKVHSDISPNKNDFIMPGLAMASPKGSDPKPQPGGLDLMGMKLMASFEGTQDGTVWINMKNGMVQENSLNQDLKGKISVSILDFPMSMKMVTGYRVQPVL